MTDRADVHTDRPDTHRTDRADVRNDRTDVHPDERAEAGRADRADDLRQADQAEVRPEVATDAPSAPRGERPAPLLDEGAATALAGRWEYIQAGFLDSPQQAVEDADHLVQEAMGQLAQRMTEQRERLDDQWRGGQEVSTEDLRRTLQQYRSFFQRLLAV